MRVMFVHDYYRQRGGEDVVVESEMALLAGQGDPVALYSRHNDELQAMGRLEAGAQTLWSQRTVRELLPRIEAFRPDVIHVHNSFPLISPAVHWAAARAGVPTVQTLHNFRLLCPQATLLRDGRVCEDCVGRVPWRGVRHRCYRQSAGQSTAVVAMLMLHRALGTWRTRVARYVALSEFSRAKYVRGGLPADRIEVVPNFADIAAAPAADDGPREGLLFVGRLSEEKGVTVLAQAARRLPGQRFRIVGDGPLTGELSALPNVSLLGRLPREAVYREMRRAQALVVPSVGFETFGMVVVEAYACGLPVIGAARGGIQELVQPGLTGLLVAPESAEALAAGIEQAVADPAFLAQAGRAARRVYEQRFTPGVAYAERRRLYEQVVAER